jgi:hypothetical protein
MTLNIMRNKSKLREAVAIVMSEQELLTTHFRSLAARCLAFRNADASCSSGVQSVEEKADYLFVLASMSKTQFLIARPSSLVPMLQPPADGEIKCYYF